MKFKKGDKVRFKSPDSANAEFFIQGLKNLEIENQSGTGYRVWKSDRSRVWWVKRYELELDKIDWRKELE